MGTELRLLIRLENIYEVSRLAPNVHVEYTLHHGWCTRWDFHPLKCVWTSRHGSMQLTDGSFRGLARLPTATSEGCDPYKVKPQANMNQLGASAFSFPVGYCCRRHLAPSEGGALQCYYCRCRLGCEASVPLLRRFARATVVVPGTAVLGKQS